MNANPFSFPKEKQIVLKQSPCKEVCVITVTEQSSLSKQYPVLGFKIW